MPWAQPLAKQNERVEVVQRDVLATNQPSTVIFISSTFNILRNIPNVLHDPAPRVHIIKKLTVRLRLDARDSGPPAAARLHRELGPVVLVHVDLRART